MAIRENTLQRSNYITTHLKIAFVILLKKKTEFWHL